MDNKNTFGYKFGAFVGKALVGLLGIAAVSTMAALTIKFLSILITWLFF